MVLGQVDNDQYGSQTNEISLNPNASYTKDTTFPSYTEKCKETVYEDINCLVVSDFTQFAL